MTDNLFNSRIINYIIGRMQLLKMCELMMPYSNAKLTSEIKEDKELIKRLLIEREEYKKIRKIVLSEVRIILVMSRARGGVILESFLKGDIDKDIGETLAGVEGIDAPKRSIMDKILGRNKIPKRQT